MLLPRPLQVDFDHVLTTAAIDKLHTHGLLSDSPSAAHFWEIEHLTFYREFPYIKFHNKKIAAYFNQPVTIVYLGFRENVGLTIYARLFSRMIPEKANIMTAAHSYIDARWAARSQPSATFDTPVSAEMVMAELGLTREIREEVKVLHLEFQRNASIFQDYFNKNPHKNAQNLQIVDFVHELINKRMAKLERLNDVILQNLL